MYSPCSPRSKAAPCGDDSSLAYRSITYDERPDRWCRRPVSLRKAPPTNGKGAPTSVIRAVVVDPDAPNRLALADVEEPSPTPSEVLVRVAAVSLNRGEVRRAESREPGFRPGWDLAGTVERASADGSGPREGSRVVGFLPSGAWAELVAVPTDSVAALPEGVSFEEASTLPVAGLTALYALEEGGNVLGRSVLVTGASGGAGQFGLQLARAAGARVVGLVRRKEHAGFVEEAGAHEVVVDESGAAAGSGDPIIWSSSRSVGRCWGTRSRCWPPAGPASASGRRLRRRSNSTPGPST